MDEYMDFYIPFSSAIPNFDPGGRGFLFPHVVLAQT